MGRSTWIVVGGVVVAAALVLALVGTSWLGFGGEAGRQGAADEAGADPLAAGGPGATVRADEGEGDAGPVLFGRPPDQRVGRGRILGKVANVEGGAAVAGARLLIAGTGYGREDVQARVTSSEDGGFLFEDLPAGAGYVLRAEAEGLPTRALPLASVESGGLMDLGTLWLGGRGRLEGQVVDPEGRPVRGATVALHAGQSSPLAVFANFAEILGKIDQAPVPISSTETDAAGRFVFEAADPGLVTLVVEAAGWQQARRQHTVTPQGEATAPLVVRLEGGLPVAGRVVDAEDHGLAGVRIAMLLNGDPESFLHGRRFTTTGDDGAFRFDAAPPEEDLVVLAAARGYPTAWAKARSGVQDVRIVLRGGATVGLTFRRKSDDQPVVGADVLVAVGKQAKLREAPDTLVGGRTDEDGRVVLDVMPGVFQMVMVSQPAMGPAAWSPEAMMAQALGGRLEPPASTEIHAGAQEMVFTVLDGLEVTGRVLGPQGEPIAGARVRAFGGLGGGSSSLSDAEGRYRLVVASPMMVMAILAEAEGYVQDPASIAGSMGSSEPPSTAGGFVRDIHMKRAGVITGRVVAPDGTPLAGVRVRASGGDRGLGGLMQVLGVAEAFTGRDGRYVLDGVPPGDEMRVVARLAGYVDGGTEKFPVRDGATTPAPELRLEHGATLVVDVLGPDGRGVAAAVVQAEFRRTDEVSWAEGIWGGSQQDASTSTDAHGRARIEGIPPGEVEVSAHHPEHASASVTVKVEPGQRTLPPAELQLREAAELVVRVLDGEGRPLSGASVQVTAASGSDAALPVWGRTDAEGTFRRRLPRVALEVGASAEGFRRAHAPAELPGGPVVLQLEPLPADLVARRKELEARQQELLQRFQQAEDEQERQALMQEFGALQRELQSLDGEGPEAPEVTVTTTDSVEEELPEIPEEGVAPGADPVVPDAPVVDDR